MSRPVHDRKAKILITAGPATSDAETLRAMLESGVDGFRFNFSHGSIDTHLPVLERIRELCDEMNRDVACMADLQGPKIRIGTLPEEPLELREGQSVYLYVQSAGEPEVGDVTCIPVEYENLIEDVSPGVEIFLSDGQIKLEVEDITDRYVRARTTIEGPIWSRKGFNIPDSELSAPSMTDQDVEDLKGIVEEDFDMVALSFVRRAEDLEPAREILDTVEKPMDLIAKIESRGALDNLDDIIGSVEGIMVARGDLGAEIGVERVPFYQKEMINRANSQGKIVITATQMLESMVTNPVPTRAEVSDVANAVLDGSDVVMLSGETAVGDYPVRAVQTMDGIVKATEEDFEEKLVELVAPDYTHREDTLAVSMSNAAARVANEINAAAIVAPTSSGFTARMISNTYPLCPIIAPSMHMSTRQKVSLYRNVHPYELETITDTDRLMTESVRIAREMEFADPGDRVLLLTGLPITQPGVTNFFHVMEVEEK